MKRKAHRQMSNPTLSKRENSRYKTEHLQSSDKKTLYLGVDIGSTSSDLVVLDKDGKTLFSDYRFIRAGVLKTLRDQLQQAFSVVNRHNIVLTAATGESARFVSGLFNIPFVNEIPAQVSAISAFYPDIQQATVIEMGGQDSKLIFLKCQDNRIKMTDFILSSACAAGTGSFLEQQANRLGIDIRDEFAREALKSKNPARMAGRCSVFAKTDMIHLQQQAAPNEDIIAGLCMALSRNLKSTLGAGREFIQPVFFTGGVAANKAVVKSLRDVLELPENQPIVPKQHFFSGAIGAVQLAKQRENNGKNKTIEISRIDSYLKQHGSSLQKAPRREKLNFPSNPFPESRVYKELLQSDYNRKTDAYLGLDVGSISTNVVVMDNNCRILSKAYLKTAGKPLEAVKKGLSIVAEHIEGKVNILGCASTGSGRYLTGDFIGADTVINEITAQAAGAAIVNPKVDTIFEIGGQDSKYISLKNGVVVDFEMNHACAAGTGSFLEEQAQRLNIDIDGEFADLAFRSRAPFKLGERCTVFMETDLLAYQQQGAKIEDLIAGLSYSIVTNYLNRVVGRKKIGKNICFQGGTAFNKAVLAAFEKVTEKSIIVPDHHEVTGALGAASVAKEFIKNNPSRQSKFRGFAKMSSVSYQVNSFPCEHCPNHCEIKQVKLPGSEPLYYGSRCDRYNIKKTTDDSERKLDEAFGFRDRKLLETAGLNEPLNVKNRTLKIGIPKALVFWELLPMFSQFFRELNCEVVLSGSTNKTLIRKGIESVTAPTCFPVKVAYGHIAELIESDVDRIFIPGIASMMGEFPDMKTNQLCPLAQSLAYQVRTAFENSLPADRILTEPMYLGNSRKLLLKSFIRLAEKLGLPNISKGKVKKAVQHALKAQDDFKTALKQKGRRILRNTGTDEKIFVLVSRPYNGCDMGMNLQLPRKLAKLGVKTIPMDMLPLNEADLSNPQLHRGTYWTYGQKILRTAEIVKRDSRMFAVYLSNFSCGPDSFLMSFFKDITADKPSLYLELDEHSADAGLVTRLEAFFESLKNHKKTAQHKKNPPSDTVKNKPLNRRTIFIPYMSDCAYGIAAAFRRYGQPAEVMPKADEKTLLKGRQYTTGKECLPLVITAGEMLQVIESPGFESEKAAFFMPSASGPCRFGMYHNMHKLILKFTGRENIPIISPNQDTNFYKEIAEGVNHSSLNDFLVNIWISTVGIDLLRKVLFRLRPYAENPNQVEIIYRSALKSWIDSVEQGGKLSQMKKLMQKFADDFADIKLNNQKKPRVGIVGEIYIRNHEFGNLNIIDRLEKTGVECSIASLAEWIYYTNFCRYEKIKRNNKFYRLFQDYLQNFIQHKIEKQLAAPLEKQFGQLAEEPIKHTIECASPFLPHSFEGEAILTIGKIIEYHQKGFDGVVNVAPFSCMPSTVVETQKTRLTRYCSGTPILTLGFDGQEDANFTTQLETFTEQLNQNRNIRLKNCK
jgi:predicted CoA-substrate-specific enzyme activase